MGSLAFAKDTGAPFRTYSKVPGEPLTDTYFSRTCRVYYDASERVEYIELIPQGLFRLVSRHPDRRIMWFALRKLRATRLCQLSVEADARERAFASAPRTRSPSIASLATGSLLKTKRT